MGERPRATRVLRSWTIVFVGNFAGAVATALAVCLAGTARGGNGAFGEAAFAVAQAKLALHPVQAVVLGMLGNALVCLAVWLGYSARTTADRILAIVPPISAFVAAGFEHSVANMYFVPLGLLIQWGAPDTFWADLGRSFPAIDTGHFLLNLGAVTLGNWVGGAVLVGAVYWFIYRRR